MSSEQNRLGEVFRNLHSKDIFVMPNAWDAGSARMLAGAGYSAIFSQNTRPKQNDILLYFAE